MNHRIRIAPATALAINLRLYAGLARRAERTGCRSAKAAKVATAAHCRRLIALCGADAEERAARYHYRYGGLLCSA